MRSTFGPDGFTAINMRFALNENFPEANYGAIPVIDQYELLETYLAFNAENRLSRHDKSANDIPITARSM